MKGSRIIVERLQHLIAINNLKEKIELAGTFCMGKCQTGVNVTVNDECYSVSPETVDDFFSKHVVPLID